MKSEIFQNEHFLAQNICDLQYCYYNYIPALVCTRIAGNIGGN